ncbi:MAG: hypothetical protein AB1593_11690 [Pseudomonadota bacterium]
MRDIPVVYAFARSGGTLVNQLLGSHSRSLVLSEVNPAACCVPVLDQAVQWLGLIETHEQADFAGYSYGRLLRLLQERAGDRGRTLVVRDWVSANFLPNCCGERAEPSGALEQDLYLRHAGLEPRPIVIARRAASILASIRATFDHLASLSPETFLRAYGNYAQSVSVLPVVHLEELQSRPVETTVRLLEHCSLDTGEAESLQRTFHEFVNCTGNNTLQQQRASSCARVVLREQGDAHHENWPDLEEEFAAIDRMFGYA